MLTEAQVKKHPAIIGQPRFRSDMFSKFGWWKVEATKEDGDFYWPLMCYSMSSAGDCEVCAGIPLYSSIMAERVEILIHQLDMGVLFLLTD